MIDRGFPAGWGAWNKRKKSDPRRHTKKDEGPRRKTEGDPSLFVSIRVHWWFVFKFDRQFLPRMIRPAVGGGGGAYLKQTP